MRTHVCAICGTLGTSQWTIDNLRVAVVAHLCPEHAAPLEQLVKIAGTQPPSYTPEPEVPRRQIRKRGMVPLDWTPPS